MRPFPPLGLMSLASGLRSDGFSVSLCDNTFEPDLSHFENLIKTQKPVLVGISSVEISRRTACEMIGISKKNGSRVILGGPDPVNYRKEFFNAGADWICEGEGERTIVELAKKLLCVEPGEIRDVKGLYFSENGHEFYTGKRELVDNLDSLPPAAWDILPINFYLDAWKKTHGESALSVMSSRGCVRSCRWCSRNVFGKTFRRRSASNFVNELQYVAEKYSPDYFWFADDSFSTYENWLRDFEHELAVRKLKLSYECLCRVDELTVEIASLLKLTGARFAWFGAESGSQRVLDSMKKGFNVGDIRRAREIMGDYGIKVGFFIMLGYPPEEISDIDATVKMVRETKPDKVGVSIAYPIAGTEFHGEVMSYPQNMKVWKSSGENRPIFKTRYPSRFYRFAKRLVLKEAQLVSGQKFSGISDIAKLAFYRSGMKSLSWRG